MSHKSEKLEQYIGKFVYIKFKNIDGKVNAHIGILKHNDKGFRPYKLQTKDYDYIFTKTDVRIIEEVKP